MALRLRVHPFNDIFATKLHFKTVFFFGGNQIDLRDRKREFIITNGLDFH